MERQTAYFLSSIREKFLKKIEEEGFVYDGTDIKRSGVYTPGPIGIIVRSLRFSIDDVLLLIPGSERESKVIKDARQKLKDLADKFKVNSRILRD